MFWRRLIGVTLGLAMITIHAKADGNNQVASTSNAPPPSFKLLRGDEDWSFLRGTENELHNKLTALKDIKIGRNNPMQIWIGGEARARGEFYQNRNWEAERDESFWSHRLALHGNAQFRDRFRLFGEVFHGYVSGDQQFAESDRLGVHQGFAEFTLANNHDRRLTLRAGRQEIAFGSARLFGIREGPNIRRSFDAIKGSYHSGDLSIDAFYGREVQPSFGTFDNSSNFFDAGENNPKSWGVYSQFDLEVLPGKSELYYLGFETNQSRFNDVVGAETRHTLGLRRFGGIGERFQYNTELMYQFGELGAVEIDAFNFEIDWSYRLDQVTPGFRIEWSSGDDAAGDGEINTYNPMFVNPEYYGLAKVITPANVASMRPFLSFEPINDLNIYIEYARFWRESRDDGLYRVTRFLARTASTGQSRDIGQQFGLKAKYAINRNWSFDLDISYFDAGDFVRQSDEREDIVHVAPTLRFKF